MNSKVALIIIYNHKYDKNIDIINMIYKSKFSGIYHLVPFYNGKKENVIPVYENSFYFQGYIAQGFKHFYKEEYEHYIFVADDMVLNPSITENNYKDIFKINNESGFIPEMDSMPGPWWPHNRKAINYDPYKPGVEIKSEIPTPSKAQKIIDKFNIKSTEYKFSDVYFPEKQYGIKNIFKQSINYLYDKIILRTNLKKSKYPFVRSYSDIFIVSGKNVKTFIHYCGVFAATDLWVELAIPTALVLSEDKISVQNELKLQGKPLWNALDYKELEQFDNSLFKLINNFPSNYIYLHPIKLSKWIIDI